MPVQSEAGARHASSATEVISAKIERVKVCAYTVPTDFPESDGTIEWDKTTIVIAEVTSKGERGLGYSYADATAAKLICDHLAHVVQGRNAMDVAGAWHAMAASVRNIGRPGIASMAISALDIALWDLKSRLLGVPLFTLLGPVREEIPAYGSGGFTSYSVEQLKSQLGGWASSGMWMVKMKIGRNPEQDLARVQAARDAIGDHVQLFVDANGAYSRKQAVWFAERFREFDVRWFEEPVSSDDLEGLHLLRDRVPAEMEIAAGEYGFEASYFRRMLDAGAVDVLQADGTRCGGITGFLQAGNLCLARSMPFSAHTAPSIHAHVGCAVQQLRHVEYFHDHVRIEQICFDGAIPAEHGMLRPNSAQPGLGLNLRRAEMQRYLAFG